MESTLVLLGRAMVCFHRLTTRPSMTE